MRYSISLPNNTQYTGIVLWTMTKEIQYIYKKFLQYPVPGDNGLYREVFFSWTLCFIKDQNDEGY